MDCHFSDSLSSLLCILTRMSKEHPINGPEAAAAILSFMPSEDRTRLVEAIRSENPVLAARIEDSLFNFERITEVADTAVQKLLREVPHRDVVISLKAAPEPVREKILENVSDSRKRLIQDDIESLPPMRSSDVHAAQRRILKRLEDLYPDTVNAPVQKRGLPRLA